MCRIKMLYVLGDFEIGLGQGYLKILKRQKNEHIFSIQFLNFSRMVFFSVTLSITYFY